MVEVAIERKSSSQQAMVMTFLLVVLGIVVLAVLAPVLGVDSRGLTDRASGDRGGSVS